MTRDDSTPCRKEEFYLHCIQHFGMVNSNRGYWISGVLSAWNVENPVVPVTGLGFSISICIHSKSLPTAFVPGPLIPMSIGKLIDPKSMHFVRKIFTSICIPISKSFEEVSISI